MQFPYACKDMKCASIEVSLVFCFFFLFSSVSKFSIYLESNLLEKCGLGQVLYVKLKLVLLGEILIYFFSI